MKLKIALLAILLVPFLVLAQDAAVKKKAYYFYGEQCPHCKKVDEFFRANGIYDKYDITKLEVVSNPFNAKLFLEFGKAFGVNDWGGVPTIVFGDKYLRGDTPIINNFVREIEAAKNTDELPTPDKIRQVYNQANNQANDDKVNSPPVQTPEKGNKKNYFPVVIIALIVGVAGALVYINRKKS